MKTIDPLEEDFEQPHLDDPRINDLPPGAHWVGHDKVVVEHKQFFLATRFEDSDNMPDDPENNWEEEVVF